MSLRRDRTGTRSPFAFDADGQTLHLRPGKNLPGSPRNTPGDPRRVFSAAKGRLFAALGATEAVVHVVNYPRDAYHAKRTFDYITRNGEHDIETIDGKRLVGADVQDDFFLHFSSDFRQSVSTAADGRKSREAIHFIISAPAGVKPKTVEGVTRDFLYREFGGEHQGMFSIHDDTDNPHAHVMVAMRNDITGNKLRVNQPDLKRWRDCIAEEFTRRGVIMAASQRWERGLPKPGHAMRKDAAFYRRRRQEISLADQAVIDQTIRDYVRGDIEPTAYERRLAAATAASRQRYLLEADALISQANKDPDKPDKTMAVQGQQLKRFAAGLYPSMTQRQYITWQLTRCLDPVKAQAISERSPTITDDSLILLKSYFQIATGAPPEQVSQRHRFRMVEATYKATGIEPPDGFREDAGLALAYVAKNIEAVEGFYAESQRNPRLLETWESRQLDDLAPSQKMKSLIAVIARQGGATYGEGDIATRAGAKAWLAENMRKRTQRIDARAPLKATDGMANLAQKIAAERNIELPEGVGQDFHKTREFLDHYARRKISTTTDADRPRREQDIER